MRPFAVAAAIALLTACAADSALDPEADFDTAAPPSETAAPDDDVDGGNSAPPAWLGLSGELEITSGLPTAAGSVLDLSWHAADGTPLCERAVAVLAVELAAPPEELALTAWWDLTLDPTPDRDCPHALPSALDLGFAAYDDELAPAADAAGWASVESSLYAVFARVNGGAAFVFGVAGTEAQFEGELDAVLDGGVPDGLYAVDGLYLLPLTSAR